MDVQGSTADQYDALVATGSLDEARVELLDGGLFAMAPQGPLHAGFTDVSADAAGTPGTGSTGQVPATDPLAGARGL